MALQNNDLFIVQRSNQSYKMPASQLTSFITLPSVGNGTITITQSGRAAQTFTVNQSGNKTISLGDNNTTYSAGNGLTLSGTTFSFDRHNTITVDSSIKVNTGNLGISTGTSVVPGEGLRNGSSTGSNNNTITGSGTISVDTSVIRTTGNQTMSNDKTFNNMIYAWP